VVSFTLLLLYSQGKNNRYPLYGGLVRPQSRSGRRGEEKILDPTGNRTPTPGFSSSLPIATPTELSLLSVCYLSYESFVLWFIKALKYISTVETDKEMAQEGILPTVSDPEYDSDMAVSVS
jgi:hypothetical protein